MKLRKILMIIVCVFLMPIIVNAEELRPYQKALKETAGAFLRKVPYVRYSNAKDMKKITPEMASEQNNIYTECAAFVDEVYREALGMNLKHSTLHMAGCAYIQKDAHPEVVRKIWGPDDEGFSEQPPSITLNSMLEYIKTGDVVIGVQYDSKAHTTMVYDINESQTTLINSNEWGDGTNLSNKVDVHLYYDSMGGVGLWNLEEKIQSYFKNCKYVFIIRPVVEDGNQIKQIIDFNGTGHGNSTDLYDLTKYPCNEYASSKQNVSIPDTTTCRLNHPGMSITKTVSAKDKNIINKSEVEVGDLLTYKIVIKNNSNSDYTDLNVVENIPANVIYKSSSSGSSVDNGKVSWSNFTVPKNGSKELTYTVKVKKEALGTTISSTGSVCSITTAEITNSVGKKLHSIDKNSIIQSFNNSDKTNSKELINEIYYNTTGISNLLGNFDLRDLVVYTNERKNEEGKPIRDEDGKTIAEVIYDSKGGSNPKAISLSQDNSLYDIVYNNYYGGIVEDGTYTEDDVTKTQYKMHYWEYNWLMSPLRNKYSSSEPNNPAKDERYSPFYLTPSSNYRSAMADTIIKDHFETGDILITLVDGVQHEYIYLEDKFYNKSGSFPETLDSNNYNFNKLFMSDRYVILRPALTMQAKLSKPHLDSPAEYTYTGNEIIPAIYDYEEELMTSSGTKNATNVGNYSMTISLKDKINYMWTDKNAVDIVLNWKIVKADRPAPTVIDYSAQYDGNSHTIDATASEGTLVYSIDRLTWSDTKPTRTEVGTTTVYVKAVGDSNHNDSEIIESTIEITKKQMIKSALSNTRYEYMGDEITPEIINYDSNIMSLSGDINGTDPNNYSMIVSLKNKSNYEWEDGTTADVTLNWEINRKKLVKPTISIPEYTYTGDTITPVISNYSSDKMRKNGVSSATNAGNYTVSIELRDKVRYVWQDESDFDVEINWKINKTDREKPTVQSYSKAYDGAPHSVTVTGEGTPEYSLDGITWSEEKPTRTEVGTTTVYVRIKEAQNYNASEVVEGSITIIAKTKIAKPIMNQIEYTYNGEEITPVISNYDSNVMNVSGTASSINSGNYSVKIGLKDKENNQWADGTNSDITLNWKINKANRNAPTVESYSGIYDGTSHSIEVTGEGVIGYSIDGLVWTEEKPTRTEVGTVTVYVKVFGDSNHNESEVVSGTITIIAKTQKVKPTILINEYTYSGEEITPTISNYDSNVMNISGTTSSINSGNYNVTISLKNKAIYEWADGTNTDITLNWKINKAKKENPIVVSYGDVYDGDAHTIEATGEGIIKYSLDKETWSEEKPTRTEVGITTVYVKVVGDNNYNDSDIVEGTIAIASKTQLVKPTMSITEYTYTGEEITPIINNYDGEKIELSGIRKETKVGNYSVTFGIKDKKNYEWADGTKEDVTLNWKINKANRNAPIVQSYSGIYDGTSHSIEVTGEGVIGYSIDGLVWVDTKPTRTEVGTTTVYVKVIGDSHHNDSEVVSGTITIVSKTQIIKPIMNQIEYIYTGEEITPIISNYDSNVMNISGTTSSINSGNYSVTISLKNKAIYEWADGTDFDITFNWKINKTNSRVPVVQSYSGIYDGNSHTIGVTGEGQIQYSLDNETWTDEKPTRTEVGTTTVYVKTVGDKNHNDSEVVEGTIKIVKQQIIKPTMSITEYTYTGEEITPIINNYDGEKIELTGIRKETEVGNYSVTFGIKNKNNYEWAEGTKEDVTLNWKINKANRNAPIVQSYSGIYDGTSHSIEVTGEGVIGYSIDGLVWVDTKPTRTEVGTTTVYVKVIGDSHHNDSEVVVGMITVQKRRITKPLMTIKEYTYNGEEIIPGMDNYDSDVMNISGTVSAEDAGNYSVKIELKDKINNQWTDGTDFDITFNWKINKIDSKAPVVQSYSGIYDGTSHSIEVTGEGVIGYSIDGLAWVDTKPTRTEVGITTVYVKTVGDKNHNDSEIVSGTIEIMDDMDYEIEDYEVDETNKYIKKINVNTDVGEFKKSIKLGTGYSVDIDYKDVDNKKLLYTGGKTDIMKGDTVYREYTNVVVGDTNGDAEINSADLLKIRQHLLNVKTLNDEYFIASDVNYDNEINSADLLKVRQHLLGIKKID